MRISDYKFSVNQVIKDNNRNLRILNRQRKRDEKHRVYKYYKYKCNNCGWDDGWIYESNLSKGVGCSCCNGMITVEGINDIPTTAPWMIKYFQGGYAEAKLYQKESNKKIRPICPECGRIKPTKISVNNIYNKKSISCVCSDGISYPEKFMYYLLTQLSIEFLFQKTFNWAKNVVFDGVKYKNKKYDFYIPNFNCIIETHGGQHYKQVRNNKNRTLEKEQQNDKFKEKLAKENGVKNYITIDCRKSELEWIKNSILNSELNILFDLSKIDWSMCEKNALQNICKKVCQIKQNNPELTTRDIGDMVGIHRGTVVRYLKYGSKFGWCNYDVEKEKFIIRGKGGVKSRKQIEIFKNGVSMGIFHSATELSRCSEKNFGTKLLISKISNVCNGKRKYHKGFTFKYI